MKLLDQLVVLGVVLAFAAPPSSALDLDMPGPAEVQGGEVRFNTIDVCPAERLPTGHDFNVVTTPSYKVYADLNDITWSRHRFFRYSLYVLPRRGVEAEPACFIVNGAPVGTFPVQDVVVDFVVTDGQKEEKGRILLPVSGPDATGYLVVPSLTEPQEVELPGGAQISLALENLLPKLPISVDRVQPPLQNRMWSNAGLEFKDRFQIEPGRKRNIMLVLEPNSAQALTRLLFSKTGQTAHEKVLATLDYSTPWGVPGSLAIEIPVRFVPWPPLLFLALTVGTLLGSVIPILTRQRPGSCWPRAFLASLLIAFVVELLAMVLVSFDSKFRLLGVEIDPFQLLPAMLIGVFMGLLGFRSLDILMKLLSRLDTGQAGATV
jgi:hypothetical protein